MKILFLCLFGTIIFDGLLACTNKFDGKDVRAAGDWSLAPIWNANEPNGLMKFDLSTCSYIVAIGGLKANTQYKWKVVIGGSWSQNYGCSGLNGPDCIFKTNAEGGIRLIFKQELAVPQLASDFNYVAVDFKLPCNNPYKTKDVRAADWSGLPIWNAAEPLGLMTYDEQTCLFSASVTNLKPNFQYKWKVVIGNTWTENYGCSGLNGPDCAAKTNENGAIRFIFNPNATPFQLTTDYNIDLNPATLGTTTAGSTVTGDSTTTRPPTVTTSLTLFNPVIPCSTGNCPQCAQNNFASKLLRVSGDWAVDAGSAALWNAAEPLGLLSYEEKLCSYSVVVTGLKKNFQYKWKLTVDNAWKENYGCSGLAGPDCAFKSNSAGAVRFIVKPTSPPQLTTDYNVAPCGDNVCEEGETCSYCPQDCGECPPPVCGDGICEDTESFVSCPEDCPNELPNCERFNDESCKSGGQFHANEGVGARRWQTPKPGQKGYLPGFQDYHSLVGYADIRYTSPARTEADVCIIAIHKNKNQVTFQYYFNNAAQPAECKRFTSAHKGPVSLKVTASDGTQLVLADVELIWNNQKLASRPGDFRNGQKGGVAEMFGWPHKDVTEECELLGKAGYLGVKLFPVHEQLMSTQPFNNVLNPWYFMYQPVSYKLDGRAGTREELQTLINTCRSHGVRIYVDAVLNHMTGAGNDLHDHRNPSAGCAKWGNKTSSAPLERQSSFYTHAYTYKYNPNSGQPPSNEFTGAALGPEDFHCDRSLGSWSDLFILNNGWLVGLTDIDTSRDNVRERQAAYLVEMMSMGVSGFRFDAAKHMSPEDLSAIFKKIQQKMGGQLPDDFFAWLEILTGGESGVIWTGPSWYGTMFEGLLKKDLGSQSEVDKIKMWDGLYI